VRAASPFVTNRLTGLCDLKWVGTSDPRLANAIARSRSRLRPGCNERATSPDNSDMLMRRYEVLLPSQFNDGHDVVDVCMRCLPDTLMEVVDRFGALSFDKASTQGAWLSMGRRFDDQLSRLTLDVPDTEENRAWVAAFKRTLLDRFDQLEIYVVAHPIDVI
jgi:hypothetical protein